MLSLKSIGISLFQGLLRLTKLACFTAILVFLASLMESSRIPTTLEKVLESGEIKMVSRNGPTTYFEGPNGLTGFDYILAKAFADFLGVNLTVAEEEDLGLMLNAVDDGDADFAAAALSVTPQRLQQLNFAPPYFETTQKLIYHSRSEKPKKIEDLYGKTLVVIANSSHAERLAELKKTYPKLKWQVRHDLEMMELLELVHTGEIDHTIVDSNALALNSSLYPRAQAAMDISDPQAMAWAFPKSVDRSLLKRAEAFFQEKKTTLLIADATEEFYGHIGKLNYSDSLLFTYRVENRMPKWRDKLIEAAKKNNLDWQLLAALSYQESHWNPRAKSPTGVRGFMMLTLNTAKEVGVTNRLNADQSIAGGAKYFKRVYDRIPDDIKPPDRTWFALAAYNIGYGHLEDARILTEHFGHDPHKWKDVREHLLLLAKRKYYKSTKHGYARGWEAVDYVQSIRNFYAVIAWHEKTKAEQQIASNAEPTTYAELDQDISEAVHRMVTPVGQNKGDTTLFSAEL